MFCGHCGRQIDDNAAVCPFCGQAQARRAASAAPAANPGYTPAANAGYMPAGKQSVSAMVKNLNKKQKNILVGALAAVILLIVIIVALAGRNELVGRWVSEDGDHMIEFNRDGTGELDYGDLEFDYEVEDGKVTLYNPENHNQKEYLYYKLEKGKLYIAYSKSGLRESIEQGEYLVKE